MDWVIPEFTSPPKQVMFLCRVYMRLWEDVEMAYMNELDWRRQWRHKKL